MNKHIHKLFGVAWIVYFIAYIGRLNYAASMLEIGLTEGYDKGALGAVVTALFISYGIGQLISGFLGDLVPPGPLVTTGLLVSALCNFFVFGSTTYWQLILLWFMNGFAMSLLWSPMLKVFTLYMPADYLRQCCFKIQTSVALGTCFTYLLCSFLLSKWSWRLVFLVASLLLVLAALLWHLTLMSVSNHCVPIDLEPKLGSEAQTSVISMDFTRLVMRSGLPCLLIGILVMGILKDGVMTWIPQLMRDTFHTSNTFSIFLSAFLPLVNLLGIWGAKKLHERSHQNDIQTSAVLYLLSLMSFVLLVGIGTQNLWVCLILFAGVTSSMLGINTILVSVLPTYFAPYGKVSTVAGIANSTMYLGSALCGYGLGSFSELYGWHMTLVLLLVICLIGLVTCLLPMKAWARFKLH